jgi:hypothetical protein
MLTTLHTTIRTLLRQEDSFPADQVDIVFRAPEKSWVEKLEPPTIVFSLLGLRENTDLRRSSPVMSRSNGKATRRAPLRLFDLRYVVCAFDKEQPDNEYALLWNTLTVLLRHSPLPGELLPEPVRTLDVPIATQISSDEDQHLLELWSALGITPRPVLVYVVTMPLDLELTQTWPVVQARTTRYRDLPDHDDEPAHPARATALPDEARYRDTGQVSGIVRAQRGQPLANVTLALADNPAIATVSDKDGRFTLNGIRPGELVLTISYAGQLLEPIRLAVPADTYDITLARD